MEPRTRGWDWHRHRLLRVALPGLLQRSIFTTETRSSQRFCVRIFSDNLSGLDSPELAAEDVLSKSPSFPHAFGGNPGEFELDPR